MYWSGSHHISAAASSQSAAASLLPTPQPSCDVDRRDRSSDRYILFLLYTADLRLPERHNLRPHMYADDTQIYGFCRPAAAAQLQEQVSACIDDVAAWMQSNRLHAAEHCKDRSYLVRIGSTAASTTTGRSLRVGILTMSHQLPQFAIGIYVDCDVSMRTHVSRLCPCFAVLRHAAAQHSSVCVASSTTVAGCVAGAVPSGLWLSHACRSTWLA